ncbi:MAG: hypothetical protein D6771_02790 [Zetaproteobacteria bacterium]|nr:MAG: hypothetical protein D6771_02790 [Zetaproteobacteria bacterium]
MGVIAAGVYALAMLLPAVKLGGEGFSLASVWAGKLGLLFAVAAAILYGLGKRMPAKVLGVVALLLVPIGVEGIAELVMQDPAVNFAAQFGNAFLQKSGMPKVQDMVVSAVWRGLSLGFYLALLAGVAIVFAPKGKSAAA